MPSDSDPIINTLLQWCSAHGIQIDARTRVARGEDGSICVFARDVLIEPRTTLVTIPKTAILSIRNCSLTQNVPQVIYGTEGQLGLALALYGELLRGSASPWFGYLQSLPKRVSLPLFWDETVEDEKSALYWVEGTMADVELSKSGLSSASDSAEESGHTIAEFLRYYEFTVLPALANAKLKTHATPEGFKHAYALVSSRSFIVDAYHGLAMVPIADAFNHSLENQVHLESDYEVCPTCGSLDECPHDADDQIDWEHTTVGTERALSGSKHFDNTCEMVTNASVPSFAEVFNTYGEHLTNAQLLVRYGFLLDVNENDVISWDASQLREFVALFIENSSDGESCGGEALTFKRSIAGVDFFNEEPGSVAKANMFGRRDLARFHVNHGETLPRSIDRDHEDLIIDSDLILGRLKEVFELWACDEATFADSSLVYFTGSMRTAPVTDIFCDRAEIAEDSPRGVGGTTGWHQSGKHLQPYFALDDEARISHHLWIFCTLLALHAQRLHLSSSLRLDSRSVSDAESYRIPRENEDTTFCRGCSPRRYQSGARYLEESGSDPGTRPLARMTTVEEDISLLKQLLLVQSTLENFSPDSEVNIGHSQADKAKEILLQASSSLPGNLLTENELSVDKNKSSVLEERCSEGAPQVLESISCSTISESRRPEVHAVDSRKRLRASSTSSTASYQNCDSRARLRVRRTEDVDVRSSGKSGEAVEEDNNDIPETKFDPLEECNPIVNRQGRERDDGLIRVLLRDYGDEFDDELHPSPESEAELPSAVGGRPREESCRDGIAHVTDADTRKCSGQRSETQLPEKEEKLSDIRDRSADDSGYFLAPAGALNMQKVPRKLDPEDALRDTSLLRLVAWTARVVSALCATRSLNMAFPRLAASELGGIVDAIPSQLPLTRMAAQLSLAERVRLEACGTAWAEIRHAASKLGLDKTFSRD